MDEPYANVVGWTPQSEILVGIPLPETKETDNDTTSR